MSTDNQLIPHIMPIKSFNRLVLEVPLALYTFEPGEEFNSTFEIDLKDIPAPDKIILIRYKQGTEVRKLYARQVIAEIKLFLNGSFGKNKLVTGLSGHAHVALRRRLVYARKLLEECHRPKRFLP